MKIYKLPQLAEAHEDGTCVLGKEELKSRAIYMAYAKLRPGEGPRKLGPQEGSEEIILVLKGSLLLKSGKTAVPVGPGEAFHLKGADIASLENNGSEEAIYIRAGGSVIQAEEVRREEPQEEAALIPALEAAPEEAEPEFIITRENSNE